MESYLMNLKSFIMFMHLSGLAIGIGGAWILEAFILKHLKSSTISRENFAVVKFISSFVSIGLAILWFSGLLFLLYYFLYTPELLSNQKVWAKIAIVTMLTINGYFIHRDLLPLIEQCIGSTLQEVLSVGKLAQVLFMGVVSFFSWIFPVVLGVSQSLNFTVSGLSILNIYLFALVGTLSIALALIKPINSKIQMQAVRA